MIKNFNKNKILNYPTSFDAKKEINNILFLLTPYYFRGKIKYFSFFLILNLKLSK
jgi:hypothetical protein